MEPIEAARPGQFPTGLKVYGWIMYQWGGRYCNAVTKLSSMIRSPDGRWWSADGEWWWDGQQWRPRGADRS